MLRFFVCFCFLFFGVEVEFTCQNAYPTDITFHVFLFIFLEWKSNSLVVGGNGNIQPYFQGMPPMRR